MSRIEYEIFDSCGELSDFEKEGKELLFVFPKGTEGHLYLGGHRFELKGSSATAERESIPDGIHIPRLYTEKGQTVLPPIEFSGNKISFPEEEYISRSLSLRAARLTARLSRLEKRLGALEEYVKGTSCL